jgi:hypothetical protein
MPVATTTARASSAPSVVETRQPPPLLSIDVASTPRRGSSPWCAA